MNRRRRPRKNQNAQPNPEPEGVGQLVPVPPAGADVIETTLVAFLSHEGQVICSAGWAWIFSIFCPQSSQRYSNIGIINSFQ